MNQPNLGITPVYDYTGRGSERGGVGGIGGMNTPIDPYNNEFTRMREEANTQALYDLMGKVFPVHPALGGQVQELARMIMDTAAGQGTTTAKDREWHTGKSDPSDLDRVGGLIGKWSGNALDDVGQALGMTPDDLAQMSRTVQNLSNEPDAQLELLHGIAHSLKAKYGGEDGPMSALEDFGAPTGAIAAKGPRILGGLLKSDIGKAASGGKKYAMPDREVSDMLEDSSVPPAPRQDMPEPDWDGGSKEEFEKFLEHDDVKNPGGYKTYEDPGFTEKLDGLSDDGLADLIDELMVKKWNKRGQTVGGYEENLKYLSMAEDERRKRQQPLYDQFKSEMDKFEGELDDAGSAISLQDMTDDALDSEILEFNKILNGPEVENQQPSVFESYKEHLRNLVNERRRRRKSKAQGDSGAAYGYSTEGTEGYVDPVMVPKSPKKSGRPLDKAGQQKYAESLLDDELDKEIIDVNKTLADFASGNKVDYGTYDFQALLEKLVSELKRRQGGGGGSAGAQKQQGSIEQMMKESGKVPADLPDMKGGAIGQLAYNIENFHADADIGNVPQLLETAKWSSKRNAWNFALDPDVGVFDLNGFFTRMAHPKHNLNSDEVTVLSRVLEQAKSYPSRRNLSSMAEDLYKTMVSGPAKSALEGIGFNIQ